MLELVQGVTWIHMFMRRSNKAIENSPVVVDVPSYNDPFTSRISQQTMLDYGRVYVAIIY